MINAAARLSIGRWPPNLDPSRESRSIPPIPFRSHGQPTETGHEADHLPTNSAKKPSIRARPDGGHNWQLPS